MISTGYTPKPDDVYVSVHTFIASCDVLRAPTGNARQTARWSVPDVQEREGRDEESTNKEILTVCWG